MTLIPSLTFTDYEWFPWSICNGCGMPAGNAYPSGHLIPSPFWDLLMLQLLRPNSSNLPCLYSSFHLEYPLVLSRFCFSLTIVFQGFYIWNLNRKYTSEKILLWKGHFCSYETTKSSIFCHSRKLENLYWYQYQKLQWNFIMFKFSALFQIWKKYIQKLNAWDLPIKHCSPLDTISY